MAGPPLSVRTRFERFPATIKGAFVARGEDRDPHQLRVRAARVVRLGGPAAGGGVVQRELPIDAVTVDVPPHQDVYVPFEAAVGDMDPGWYGLELEADVDGSPRVFESDRRFAVGWPRGAVRSGTVAQGLHLQVGNAAVTVERLQAAADSTLVRFVVQPPVPVDVVLMADGSPVAAVESAFDPETGRGETKSYPLLRTHRRLTITAVRRDADPPVTAEETLTLP